jgi:hypothetical protein
MTSTTSSSPDATPLLGWKLIDPLPDRVGFGGMIAGVLGGRLVAGGGSQFPEKPLWLKGEKAFSDRIFTLAKPDAKWVEHATRLPAPIGSPASATTAEALYFAGGLNASGCLRGAWKMRAIGDGFEFTALPDLPRPIGYGAAAIAERRMYVVGGLDSPVSKSPSRQVWSLDLTSTATAAAWRNEPDLPGEGVFVAAAGSDGRDLFVFGGIGYDAAGKPVPAKAAWRLDSATHAWERLPDLPEARVGISTPCPVVPGNKLFLIGGYADVFPGAPREHPGFSAQTLYFDLSSQRWEDGPVLPRAPVADRDLPGDVGPAPMIGAPCVVWHDLAVVVGGEVRSSVRTPAVLAWSLPSNSTS